MCKFQCPKCNHKFEMNYWKWIFKSPFHWLIWDKQTRRILDSRWTKCPKCQEKSWISRKK